jgi:hypothetical protein
VWWIGTTERCRREYDEQFPANLVLQRGLMQSLDGDSVDAWILLLWHCDAHEEKNYQLFHRGEATQK